MPPFFRKNLVSILLIALMGVLLFVPNAKAFLLQGLLRTGVFNASTKKESSDTNVVAISFTDANGSHINTADLAGKVIFINFWATWCPPCIAEMGSINALYNKLKDDPRFVFIMADADNNPAKAKAFMDKRQYGLPVYQVSSPVPEKLYSGTLPTTLIIDANGQLVQRHTGIANYDTEGMIAFLRSL